MLIFLPPLLFLLLLLLLLTTLSFLDSQGDLQLTPRSLCTWSFWLVHWSCIIAFLFFFLSTYYSFPFLLHCLDEFFLFLLGGPQSQGVFLLDLFGVMMIKTHFPRCTAQTVFSGSLYVPGRLDNTVDWLVTIPTVMRIRIISIKTYCETYSILQPVTHNLVIIVILFHTLSLPDYPWSSQL